MITRIDLQCFKCFEHLTLPLRSLTLLSGANASGKSSVMQALALLHQTMRDHEWSSRLMLNGRIFRLGTVADVIDRVNGRHSCEITLVDDEDAWFKWELEGEREEMSLAVRKVCGKSDGNHGWEWNADSPSGPLHHLFPSDASSSGSEELAEHLCNLAYLTAERLGPREVYPLEDPQHASAVDSAGEVAVSVLHTGRDQRVLDGLAVKDVPAIRRRQVEARLGQFFPHCKLHIAEVPGANAVTLGLQTSSKVGLVRPTHMGFGVTQVLPIVVAIISSGIGDLVLIENPEVHLHPAGQAKMGAFMVEAAAAGVQVIIETHSDHVLNGVRRAVKDGGLSPENVALHFFRPREDDKEGKMVQVQSPALDGSGNVDHWPDGFFDQFDKDMDYFADWQ